jgi:purine-binding chemotaxis protein CheW
MISLQRSKKLLRSRTNSGSNQRESGVQSLAQTSSDRFLTFCVAEQLYALRAENVLEVMLLPALARIPQAPTALLGVANLRGSVLPVVSLRELLGKPSSTDMASARAIVLDVGAAVAIIVDSVEMLETATAQQIDIDNNELSAADAEKLVGVFFVGQDKTAAKILDIKALLESAFANRARPQRLAAKLGPATNSERTDNGYAKSSAVLVTFDVAGQEFGLTLDAVREIIPLPATITAVAHAGTAVMGVISVRDSLLPLLSLRVLLGFAANTSSDGREKIVVMEVAGTRVGLVADRALAIVAADSTLVDPIPPVLAARTGGESRIKAIYRGEAGRRLISILSPEQLFREDVMQKLVDSHKGQDGQMSTAATVAGKDLIFLVFRLGGDEFGLPIDKVVEVAQIPAQITRIPKTPRFLEGVINLRGEVLPVVDQRRRFDMPKLDSTAVRRLVVIQTERHRAALIVDGVADVLRVSADAIEPPPDLTDATSRLVKGVINLEKSQRLVLVLDPAEMLTHAEQGLLDTFQASAKKTNA